MLATREQITRLLLGGRVPRFIQDSPILPDVWSAFARDPDTTADVLLTAHQDDNASALAAEVRQRLKDHRRRRRREPASVAPLAGVAAARVYLDELFTVLLPMTAWWRELKIPEAIKTPSGASKLVRAVERLRSGRQTDDTEQPALSRDLVWLVSAAGAMLAADKSGVRDPSETQWPPGPQESVDAFLHMAPLSAPAATAAPDRRIWRIALNRTARPATRQSVLAVKADAALAVFNISCAHITWAVLDCGIASDHPAFLTADGEHRVVRTLDFTQARDLLDPARLNDLLAEMRSAPDTGGPQGSNAQALYRRLEAYLKLQRPPGAPALGFNDIAQFMVATRKRLEGGLQVDMGMLEPFLQVSDPIAPELSHGTHVAGIIGADWDPAIDGKPLRGMCPDIRLMDLRVLSHDDPDGSGSEFAVIAALQYIRHINDRSNQRIVHGANLSLFTPHDVRNNACGATPVCEACDDLVASGVMVVTAAGNGGLRVDAGPDGTEKVGYLAISITDPGNANAVLTVGSAHRERPHQYGVSYFSSRGPTGDGRRKPDLVAPGERIVSTLPGPSLGPRDGTSQAAAHASGAAALLMGRYPELIGNPGRVKQILCKTATDLGRDHYFQGAGMVDVLRALQDP
ncbi:S8 family serine peptidase [uncultured Phenylobacterium sp.]|uniref:S8 family serine peptidase n=1 Tax=uncultured Phenylobacterium sp. TaxID=349273 RepID=UPI0025E3337D|nr:S8 family serine peptidase [uncultured Phenylobacterium sp.]